MKRHLTFGVIATALFASACMQTAADPFATVSEFCQQKAKAECQVSAVCAINPDACATYRASLCNIDATAAMASGVRKYVPGNAQACIDALNGAYGNDNTKIPLSQLEGPGSIRDKCARVFSGSLDVTQSCHSDYDCKNRRVCAPIASGSASSECADFVSVSVNGFCANPGSVCTVDTYCAPQPVGAPLCTAAAAAGQACGTVPCVSAERCVGGVCVARLGPGGGCATNDDCGPTDAYCDPSAGNICTIGLTFATGAADCSAYLPGLGDAGAHMITGAPLEAGADSAP